MLEPGRTERHCGALASYSLLNIPFHGWQDEGLPCALQYAMSLTDDHNLGGSPGCHIRTNVTAGLSIIQTGEKDAFHWSPSRMQGKGRGGGAVIGDVTTADHHLQLFCTRGVLCLDLVELLSAFPVHIVANF